MILQSLKEQKDALAIVGFDFLVLNKKLVQPVKIDGVSPEFSTISSKKYSLSRPLFVYFKKEQLTMIPRMSQFIKELISKETVGRKGYLVHSGLVPLNDKEVATLEKNIGAIIE